MSSLEEKVIECPRCGYDQRGVVASWQEQCPVEGRCSECGLKWAWREIVGEHSVPPEWSFEQGTTRWRARAWGTLLRTFVPRRLWRSGTERDGLAMGDMINLRRVVVLVVVALVMLHLGFAVVQAARAWTDIRVMSVPIGTPRGARVTPMRVDVAMEVAKALVSPYVPLGLRLPSLLRGVPGEAELARVMWWGFTPLVFLSLTTTLRQAKVRMVHVVRAVLYTVPPMSSLLVIEMVIGQWHSAWPLSGDVYWVVERLLHREIGFDVAFGAMLAAQWWVIVRHYLRLPHAPWVTGVMLLIGLLAARAVLRVAESGF